MLQVRGRQAVGGEECFGQVPVWMILSHRRHSLFTGSTVVLVLTNGRRQETLADEGLASFGLRV